MHFHAARKGRGSGSAAPRIDRPVYPRHDEHNTSPREGIEYGPRLRADPLGLSNLQMNRKTAFAMYNKTGSDVFIAASTMDEAGTGKFSAVPALAAA